MTDTITLTIDNLQANVPTGTLIVDAAKQIGITIPVFCYHPKLSPVGMCRMCLVEVGTPIVDRSTGKVQSSKDGLPEIRWFPALQTACTMPVSEGMVVRTQTERVVRARKDIIEFLLTSHPLDCPICDKGGECPLQNQTMTFGAGTSRFDYADKQHLEKHVALGDLVFLDRERCIQCARCVRFQDEIVDDPVLAFANRGRSMEIITFSDPPFDSYFGGNTTDICPVGALTTADFRFGARPWELTRHHSLCSHCSVGCNITLDTRVEGSSGDWVIKRVMPRQNELVNEIWICDKGRYGHSYARAADRLTTPLIRRNGELAETTWDEALDLIAKRLKITVAAQVAGVAGDRLSNEDLFIFQALMRDIIGTPHIDTYPKAPGADLVAQYGIGADSDWAHLKQNSAILVVAGDVEEQTPIWFLRIKAAAQKGANLITVNGRETKLDRYANHHLRIRYGSAPHLILGLARLLIEPGTSIDGLGDFEQHLAGFDPVSVAHLTGIAEDDLQAVADVLGQAEDVIVVFGREGHSDYGASSLAQAASSLLLATGHVGRANNGIVPLWTHNNSQGAMDMGVRPDTGPGYQQILEHGWDFDSILAAAAQRSINCMWFAGADPVGDDPSFAKALNNLDFLIVQELFLTATCNHAHVVLPALSFAERDGTYTSGDRRVQRAERALPGIGQGRSDWAIFADVASRLGASWLFDSAQSVLAAINEQVPSYDNATLAALRATKTQWPPVGYDSLYYAGTAYQNDGGLGLRWPAAAEAGSASFSLEWVEPPPIPNSELISVPVHRLFGRGTLINRSAILEGRLSSSVAEFNPGDAERLNLVEGTAVLLDFGTRTVELITRLNETVPKGVVLVPSNLPMGPLAVPTEADAYVSGSR